jgi:hypothetical protein
MHQFLKIVAHISYILSILIEVKLKGVAESSFYRKRKSVYFNLM